MSPRTKDRISALLAILLFALALLSGKQSESATLGTMPTEEQPTTHCQ